MNNFVVIISVLLLPLALAKTPLESCGSGTGQKICSSCHTVSECNLQGNGDYYLEFYKECPINQICSVSGGVADCYLIQNDECSCVNVQNRCTLDPFNDHALVQCASGVVSYMTCGCSQTPDTSYPCSCVGGGSGGSGIVPGGPPTVCPECGYADDTNGAADCSLYYQCYDGTFEPDNCPNDLCFNPNSCYCE